MAVDRFYFSYEGNERRTEHDYAEGDTYFEQYAAFLVPKASGVVLDVGCGYGYLTKRFALQDAVTQVTGLDKISDSQAVHPKITYVSFNLSSGDPLPGGPYDTINSTEFIEHIPEADFRRLLGTIIQALRPEGRFMGSTPLNPTPYPVFSGSRYHVREYSVKDLRALLLEFFESVDVHPVSEYCIVWDARHPRR